MATPGTEDINPGRGGGLVDAGGRGEPLLLPDPRVAERLGGCRRSGQILNL